VSLVVRPNRAGEPIWLATWRDSRKRPVMRTIGAAWLSPLPADGNVFVRREQERQRQAHHRERWRRQWTKREGRAKDGTLDDRKAQAAARDLVVERELELLREAQEAAGGPRTFGELVDLWLDERQAEVQDRELKASTYRDYAAMLARADAPVRKRGSARKAHIMETFDRRPLEAITGEDVAAFERKLRAADLSPATRRKYLTVVRMLLDFGVARGVIAQNPINVQRQKHRRAREKTLAVYDLETVEKIAGKAGGMTAEAVRLAALTGLRQGELIALRWSDVDFGARRLTVARTYVAQLGEDAPKSGKTRTVPLSDQAAVVLDRLSRRERFTRGSDLVFASARGEHIDASALRRRYVTARDLMIAEAAQAGDVLPAARFHDLRHTFGTRLAAAGVPLSDLQAIMGHASIETSMIYVHYVPQHDAADRLSRAFDHSTPAEAADVHRRPVRD